MEEKPGNSAITKANILLVQCFSYGTSKLQRIFPSVTLVILTAPSTSTYWNELNYGNSNMILQTSSVVDRRKTKIFWIQETTRAP